MCSIRALSRSRPIRLLCWAIALATSTGAVAQTHRETGPELSLSSGRTVSARLVWPQTSASRPMPAVILLGGMKRGAAALDLIDDAGPVALASFDYPFSPPHSDDSRSTLQIAREARRGIHDTFELLGLLHAHLVALPEIEPTQITVLVRCRK